MGKAKPFDIPKREVWEAFKRVKANQGAAGVDAQSIAELEGDLSNNLYKLWNRLSSGSYFPPPVRRVEIPKADGGRRPLGIPTVADRIAQEVARRYLEPYLEPVFHTDSYGYRPGRSAIDAVRQARRRCWRCDWVLDIDVKGYFDSIDWELLLKAVRHHTTCASSKATGCCSATAPATPTGSHRKGSKWRFSSCSSTSGSAAPSPTAASITAPTTLISRPADSKPPTIAPTTPSNTSSTCSPPDYLPNSSTLLVYDSPG